MLLPLQSNSTFVSSFHSPFQKYIEKQLIFRKLMDQFDQLIFPCMFEMNCNYLIVLSFILAITVQGSF